MITPENAIGLRQQRSSPGKSAGRGYSLQEATLLLAGLGRQLSGKRTRDLVSLLLCHGARSWRASQPLVGLHLRVDSVHGSQSVRLQIGPQIRT